MVVAQVRDPVTLLAAIGHDLFEDGVKNIIKSGYARNEEEAKAVILEWIHDALPPYLAEPVISTIEELTRKPHETYATYIDRLLKTGSARALLIKCFDQENNLLDPDPRRMAKAMRFYLDFLQLDDRMKKESDPKIAGVYRIARASLLKRIIRDSVH